jgi:hypothetical protein
MVGWPRQRDRSGDRLGWHSLSMSERRLLGEEDRVPPRDFHRRLLETQIETSEAAE